MPLMSLELDNVMGKAKASYSFKHGINFIQGENEAGKTTILHSLAYVYCGTSISGKPNPQHLISQGEDSMKVTLP